MGIKLSDYIDDDNRKLTIEEVRDFLIGYGFNDALEKFDEKLDVTQPQNEEKRRNQNNEKEEE